ncbi:uncharacterized protein SPPG_05226 [Spizellomyces punctatus DAOM BR117]|uniref:Uncharacterized protein n=1 Tax=Spizellomyces punctatus (strain DAOM BR117) TaxID=645134 RepID=A0A0L0HFE8_SPIPD|nr:hypothetical protein, variant [Spizellomyces punctatus DAOM BR117]XP_016607893.1 uncharacterized protein SPPG_05226 [Spizellomyces punctatus DAOM BR117]KNC99852.1 hypothetical protein, variant [Spizellomyces punctatus DAOM BR117]KNC99853.1 hypothetical protein SPPG_05226 [Spizellomyces punctatus DAOM BR117]|eukprot:XP_016607892.1 hypothetical protein, variant [Spizellomyces punctatus DAOM BR117]
MRDLRWRSRPNCNQIFTLDRLANNVTFIVTSRMQRHQITIHNGRAMELLTETFLASRERLQDWNVKVRDGQKILAGLMDADVTRSGAMKLAIIVDELRDLLHAFYADRRTLLYISQDLDLDQLSDSHVSPTAQIPRDMILLCVDYVRTLEKDYTVREAICRDICSRRETLSRKELDVNTALWGQTPTFQEVFPGFNK